MQLQYTNNLISLETLFLKKNPIEVKTRLDAFDKQTVLGTFNTR